MSENLSDLLRRSADGAPELHLDVAWLVDEAGRRQRQRRISVAAAAAAVVGLVAVGSLAVRSGLDDRSEPGPALPSPSPTPTEVDPDASGSRPLVYATGSTVHVGDETFDAGGNVGFLDVTDDGVVFIIEDDDDRLWFHDGTTKHELGRVPYGHVGFFYTPLYVSTANPGSLVVWEDAERFVVYDTAQREVLTRIPFVGQSNEVVHVDDGFVYFNPSKDAPGCWVIDIQFCTEPHLFRYDLASGETTKISQALLEADLSTHRRMFVLKPSQTTTIPFGAGAGFMQVGRQLVPWDVNAGVTVVTRTSGERIRLRVPAGYTAPVDALVVSQWLDDDRIVLSASHGNGDTDPSRNGDLLVCRLPNGVCRVAVHEPSYVAPWL
jgi:hypothetical protein